MSVLSAVQLLWINIIIVTFTPLTLVMDPASEALLDRKPDKKTASLSSVEMHKQILFQSTYQIIITLIFHLIGPRTLGYYNTSNSTVNMHQNAIIWTLVFNTFIFAQTFNMVNCRQLNSISSRSHSSVCCFYCLSHPLILIYSLIEIAMQIPIIFSGGAIFQVVRIGGCK